MGSHIPENQMILCTISRQLVTLCHQGGSQGLRVRFHILGVLDKLWSVDLKQLGSKSANLVIVWSTLQCGKHSHVNAVLDVRDLVGIFVEDHASSRSTQRLVSCCGDHVAVVKWRRMLLCGPQSGDVSN